MSFQSINKLLRPRLMKRNPIFFKSVWRVDRRNVGKSGSSFITCNIESRFGISPFQKKSCTFLRMISRSIESSFARQSRLFQRLFGELTVLVMVYS